MGSITYHPLSLSASLSLSLSPPPLPPSLFHRYKLEDWSGSIMASLRPVATRSATSRQASSVSDDYSRTVLIKVSALKIQKTIKYVSLL